MHLSKDTGSAPVGWEDDLGLDMYDEEEKNGVFDIDIDTLGSSKPTPSKAPTAARTFMFVSSFVFLTTCSPIFCGLWVWPLTNSHASSLSLRITAISLEPKELEDAGDLDSLF